MSANDNKKYFYWKKHKDFYDKAIIKSVLGLTKRYDGIDGVHAEFVYERLICESTRHDGMLRLNEKTAFTAGTLYGVIGNANIPIPEFKKILVWLENMGVIATLEDGTIDVPFTRTVVKSETGRTRRGEENAPEGVKDFHQSSEENAPTEHNSPTIVIDRVRERVRDKEKDIETATATVSNSGGGGGNDDELFMRLNADEVSLLQETYEDHLELIMHISEEVRLKGIKVDHPMSYIVTVADKRGWPKK